MKNKKIIILIIVVIIVITIMIGFKIFTTKETDVKQSNIASNNEVVNEIKSTDNVTQNIVENTTDEVNNNQQNYTYENEVKVENNKNDVEEKNVKKVTSSNNQEEKTIKSENTSKKIETKKETQEQKTDNKEKISEKTTTDENKKSTTKEIDLSKYDYYKTGLNGTYIAFKEEQSEINKLKSLIDEIIAEFGYKNIKVSVDKTLDKDGTMYFTANKTNVRNLVYDSEGFSIYYYAIKEYHISADGGESYFQTRSYVKVK